MGCVWSDNAKVPIRITNTKSNPTVTQCLVFCVWTRWKSAQGGVMATKVRYPGKNRARGSFQPGERRVIGLIHCSKSDSTHLSFKVVCTLLCIYTFKSLSLRIYEHEMRSVSKYRKQINNKQIIYINRIH